MYIEHIYEIHQNVKCIVDCSDIMSSIVFVVGTSLNRTFLYHSIVPSFIIFEYSMFHIILNIYITHVLFYITNDFKSQIENTGKRKSFRLSIILLFFYFVYHHHI